MLRIRLSKSMRMFYINRDRSLLGTNFKGKHTVMDKCVLNILVPRLTESLGQNAKA